MTLRPNASNQLQITYPELTAVYNVQIDENPAAVYLASLSSERSRSVMEQTLRTAAAFLTGQNPRTTNILAIHSSASLCKAVKPFLNAIMSVHFSFHYSNFCRPTVCVSGSWAGCQLCLGAEKTQSHAYAKCSPMKPTYTRRVSVLQYGHTT